VAYRGVWRRQPRNRSRVPIEPRWQAPVPEVVGVDISGRHEEAGEYLMVAAAVHARIDATRIRSVEGVGFAAVRGGPTLDATVALTAEAVGNLPEPPDGPIVAEGGEFYEEPAGRVGLSFQPEFKYVESIGERETVQAAHHAAYAARDLLL
jgi:hypothetical protein